MNYHPVRTKNQANHTAGPQEVSNSNAGTQDNDDATHSDNEADQEYLVLPFCTSISSDLKSSKLKNGGDKPKENTAAANTSSTTRVNLGSTPVNSASTLNPYTATGPSLSYPNISNFYQDDSQIPDLEDIYGVPNTSIFTSASYDDEGAVADFTNLDSIVNVSPIPIKRIHSFHPQNQIIGDPKSVVQTRSKIEPKKISQALEEESWVDAMQEELLQFELQKVRILVDLPFRKKAIRTKWVYRNKKDDKGVSAFLYGKIDEEVYVKQPLGFEDPKFPKKVYKAVKALRGTIDKTLFLKKDKKDIILVQVYVDDIIYGSTRKSWCDEFEALMKSKFQMSSMGEITFFLGLQVKQRNNGIFISHDKYVVEILKKFDFVNVKTASTPIETQKPLVKDEEANDVDVHLYRSMIGSLMYLTASRPDIMFAVAQGSKSL
ncbi:putative ribonuclease H-like domain-containing protein [Tanacetum coccineum]